MANDIKCPNCGTLFDAENVLSADIEKKFRQEYQDKLTESYQKIDEEKKKLEAEQQLFDEKKKNENEIFAQKLQQEKVRIEAELQAQLKKSIAADFENKLTILEQANISNEEKLKQARQKELDIHKKMQKQTKKEDELEIETQKKLQQERIPINE